MKTLPLLVFLLVVGCAAPVVVEEKRATPPAPTPPAAPAAGVSQALLAGVLERERAQADAAVACATANGCLSRVPPLAVDHAEIARALASRVRDVEVLRLQSALARAVLEDAIGQDEGARNAARRALTFNDRGAVFALDDAQALLASTPRTKRAALLSSIAPALQKRSGLREQERALIGRAASALGLTRGDLLARRVGLDEIALRELANGALAGTAALVGPIATDVTFLPDARAPIASLQVRDDGAAFSLCVPGRKPLLKRNALAGPARSACDATHAGVVDATVLHAFALAGRYVQPDDGEEARMIARDIAIEVRREALATLALLDEADVAQADALASRILDDSADPIPGASIFLDDGEAGAAIDRLAGALQAAAILQSRWQHEPLDALLSRVHAAPPLDERGFPEAFVEVAKILPETIR